MIGRELPNTHFIALRYFAPNCILYIPTKYSYYIHNTYNSWTPDYLSTPWIIICKNYRLSLAKFWEENVWKFGEIWRQSGWTQWRAFWIWKICKVESWYWKRTRWGKVQIFWEGHKNWARLPFFIWFYLKPNYFKKFFVIIFTYLRSKMAMEYSTGYFGPVLLT